MDSVFPDDIKTIDGNIIVGETVGVDEEYISVKQGQAGQHCIYSMADCQSHFKEQRNYYRES